MDLIKLEHFRNLVSLAGADGKIEEVERVALSKIAYELDIPLERLNVMLDHANEYVYFIPQNQQDNEKQLEDMIRLALADGELAQAELQLIHMVGEKLGFSNQQIDELVAIHTANID